MVDERLAACVNLLAPCHSVYRWEGEVAEAAEHPALFKTTPAGAETLAAEIRRRHSYAVPAVVVLPEADGGAAFAEWVAAATRP